MIWAQGSGLRYACHGYARIILHLISSGVLPAMRMRMPFIAASRQMLVMSSPLKPSHSSATAQSSRQQPPPHPAKPYGYP